MVSPRSIRTRMDRWGCARQWCDHPAVPNHLPSKWCSNDSYLYKYLINHASEWGIAAPPPPRKDSHQSPRFAEFLHCFQKALQRLDASYLQARTCPDHQSEQNVPPELYSYQPHGLIHWPCAPPNITPYDGVQAAKPHRIYHCDEDHIQHINSFGPMQYGTGYSL